jgi:CubicO group peptidase (beta-lactamase class C family)
MRALALVFLALWATAAVAEEDRTAPVADAFAGWLADNDAKGALVVMLDGEIAGEYDKGIDPGEPAELASLSKAITAVCASEMVAQGKFGWQDSFRDIYGSGPDVTLASLVTHTSGLSPDGTQLGMVMWRMSPKPRGKDVLQLIELRQGNSNAPGTFFYSNENYALLGLAIEAVTNAPMAETCNAAALEPAGITGQVSAEVGDFLAWGGWSLSLADYGRFAAHWFGPDGKVGRLPFDFPATVLNDYVYGLGMQYETENGAVLEYWHTGLWCFPGAFDASSYVYGYLDEVSLIMITDACTVLAEDVELQDAIFDALDEVLE